MGLKNRQIGTYTQLAVEFMECKYKFYPPAGGYEKLLCTSGIEDKAQNLLPREELR